MGTSLKVSQKPDYGARMREKMAASTEFVWLGTDGVISVRLDQDGEYENLSGVTRMKLYIGGVVVDSDVDEGVFDWGTGEQPGAEGVTGKINIVLGGVSEIPTIMHSSVHLQVFSTAFPNGNVWLLPFQIHVRALGS